MDSSNFSLSNDWDVINSTSDASEENKEMKEEPQEHLVTVATEELPNVTETKNTAVGSCIEDFVPDLQNNNRAESSSSSEFDVIDDTTEDSHSNLSFNHRMEFSSSFMSSSLDSSHRTSPPPPPPPPPAPAVPHVIDRFLNLIPVFIELLNRVLPQERVPIISICFAAVVLVFGFSVPDPSSGTIKQMKEQVGALQAENAELKNQMLLKMENEKLLMALEEQIRALKGENFKLSNKMQALVLLLEEQTSILKKEKESKEQDPYRGEIEKLKEQINLLQIDNEELQKQLVRMRYGIYSPYPKESKDSPSPEEKADTKETLDQKEQNRDNSSEILTEEIKELRKKLYLEVEKLNDWKESVQNLVKKLSDSDAEAFVENEEQHFKSKESFDHAKPSHENRNKKHNKNRKPWSWKELRKNLKDTLEGLPKINVSDFFANSNFNKKVETVFETVGHYFKKAQEKTKKILDYNTDAGNDVWDFLGDLRKKWSDMKDEYIVKTHKMRPSSAQTDDHTPEFSTDNPKSGSSEDERKFKKQESPQTPVDTSSGEKWNIDSETAEMARRYREGPTKENRKLLREHLEKRDAKNSWMFLRAAYRSQERTREDEDAAKPGWLESMFPFYDDEE